MGPRRASNVQTSPPLCAARGPWLMASCALVLAGCLPSFDEFKIVDGGDAGIDGGIRDAGDAAMDAAVDATTDAGPDADAAPDGGPFTPTRVDVVCAIPWNELDGSAPASCAGREVVRAADPLVSLSLAIARARDGTLTVAYNDLEDFDFGRIRTFSFSEDTPSVTAAGPAIEPVATIGDVVGVDVSLATEAPDTHHLAYWLRSDFGSEVLYSTLRGGTLSTPQVLATAVSRAGVLDVAVDSDDRAVVAWHDDDAGRTVARREAADGTWTPAVTLRTDGDARLVGAGAISLVAGEVGTVHAAYQWCLTLAASAPSYSQATSASWFTARTLDNAVVEARASGVGASIALVGEERVVAYLDWQDGVGELRFARFEGGAVDPVVTVYLPDIILDDLPPRHPLVLKTDALGMLHLLTADAGNISGAPRTTLQYHRQTEVGGTLRWIVDTVAVIDELASSVPVDMVIGPDRRPHIVYFDPSRGGLHYATARP